MKTRTRVTFSLKAVSDMRKTANFY